MPFMDEGPSAAAVFTSSSAADLLFLLRFFAEHEGGCPPNLPPGCVSAGLARRVAELWPEHLPCWELVVLAHHAGVLTGPVEPEQLAGLLARACDTLATDLPLRSEPPEDRAVILGRLGRLRRDLHLRRSYLATVEALWSGVEEEWRTRRLPEIDAMVGECAARANRGESWRGLFPGTDFSSATLEAGWERARGEGGATVALCAYGGSLTIDLPGLQFFAFTLPAAKGADRARSEALARRLRALADPTRLALLRLLVDRPRQIGELAIELGVSQPTVSNHVRILREAGLLGGRAGERRGVALDPRAVSEVLSEAARHLGANER